MTGAAEVPLVFECKGDRLIGILHRPASPRPRGVVIVVGAPQIRVGSHRQFVLLARHLAAAGFPVLRFDYRGMGDSGGEFLGFLHIEDDIRAAIDTLFSEIPGLREVALWGLCDGASAISFYAAGDPRVGGMVLVNPWVFGGRGMARARVRRYYLRRLASADFWRGLARGEINPVRVATSALGAAYKNSALGAAPKAGARERETAASANQRVSSYAGAPGLPRRVADGMLAFGGRVLVILSGRDMTGQEFEATVLGPRKMARWSRSPGVAVRRLKEANHTYSTGDWRGQVHAWTREWLEQD
ncbi:MAG: hydrolase 1, exosortase A system-associated [Alphaproteobacteria bacterium]